MTANDIPPDLTQEFFPPDLAYREEVLNCGYSPRVIRRVRWEPQPGEARNLVFVGCKDGSIWVAVQSPSGTPNSNLLLPACKGAEAHGSARAGGIRAICPSWSPECLIIGRSDGQIGLLHWSKPSTEGPPELVEYSHLATWENFKQARVTGKSLPAEEITKSNEETTRLNEKPVIKTVSRLDDRWAYVSWTKTGGTFLVDLKDPEFQSPTENDHQCELERRFESENLFEVSVNGTEPLPNLRLACPIQPWLESSGSESATAADQEAADETGSNEDQANKIWLLVTERADIFTWSGPVDEGIQKPAKPLLDDPWFEGERPSFINDFSRWGDRDSDDVDGLFRGVFLATDRGVFLVLAKNGAIGPEVLRPHRLSLPGLGLVCTALTYAETDLYLPATKPERSQTLQISATKRVQFLWAVDSHGNSHLFCDADYPDQQEGNTASLYPEAFPNFRSSGFTHLRSQALLAYSWKNLHPEHGREGVVTFAHARRNDKIAIGQYIEAREPARAENEDDPTAEEKRAKARHLLSHGCTSCLLRFIEQHDADNIAIPTDSKREDIWDYEIIPEFAEFLAEDPHTRAVLEEFLTNPRAPISSALLFESRDFPCSECELEKETRIPPIEPASKRACIALDLWTLSLLGVVHRSLRPDESERYCLGILRWLEDSQRRFKAGSETAGWSELDKQAVLERYEDCLRMVRKWGLYGEANARRPSLVKPIEILERGTLRGQGLDLLAYEALLFQRSVDLLAEEKTREIEGNSAWSLSVLETPLSVVPDAPERETARDHWVAVSWRWTGVEILRISPSEEGSLQLQSAGVIGTKVSAEGLYEPQEASEREESTAPSPRAPEATRKKYGHSRAILLGQASEKYFLVLNTAQEMGSHHCESLYIYELRIDARPGEPTARLVDKNSLPPGESVYSLLDLGGGQILVGLRGVGGKPTLRLLSLDENLKVRAPQDVKIESSRLGVAASKENRIWSLAQACPPTEEKAEQGTGPSEIHDVLVGCGGGEIWRLEWPRNQMFSTESFFPTDPTHPTEGYCAEPIIRLSSSVRALAYRQGQSTKDQTGTRCKERTGCRVFAGGSDGSVLALQRIGPPKQEETSFASLWATWEGGGPVTHLQFVETPEILRTSPKNRYPAPATYLATITRAGYCTLFDERAAAPLLPEDKPYPGPHRIPFPGCRHGRFNLKGSVDEAQGSKAFAATFLMEQQLSIDLPGQYLCRCCTCDLPQQAACKKEDKRKGDGFGRLGVLLSASGRGTLRVQGLHMPDLTHARRQAYGKLLQRSWSESLNNEKVPQLRLGEAALGTTRAVSLALARWILEADVSKQTGFELFRPGLKDGGISITASFPRRWQLPRHFRPLLDLKRAWADLTDQPTDDEAKTSLEIIRANLEAALKASRRLTDLKLYQEICEVVLRNTNQHLIEAADQDDEKKHQHAQQLYFIVFEVVERSLEQWLGRPGDEESRARMSIAKNLVDGFSIVKLLDRAAQESSRQTDRKKAYFTRILEKRTLGVRQLVFKRDPLVSLETLRATNLSLMRMCRLLVLWRTDSGEGQDPDNRGWKPRADHGVKAQQEVRWEELSNFFEELRYSAARALQTYSKLSDAVSHEYARAFALVICACPSAAIRVANRMTEARLIMDIDSNDDLGMKVQKQFAIIHDIGLPTPPLAQELFRAAMNGTLHGNPRPQRYLAETSRQEDFSWASFHAEWDAGNLLSTDDLEEPLLRVAADIGIQNAEDYICIRLLGYILRWLSDLSEALGSDVRRLEAVMKKTPKVQDVLRLLGECSQRYSLALHSHRPSASAQHRSGSPQPGGGASQSENSESSTGRAKSSRRLGSYSDSLDFWQAAFANQGCNPPAKTQISSPIHSPLGSHPPGPIRPDLLATVDSWGAWAKAWKRDLKRRLDGLEIFQPEYGLFHDSLSQLSQIASRFRESAAVQKAVVAGVLGHHLLEDLDEHVLELEEIAQSLNPVLVKMYRQLKRQAPPQTEGQPVAEAFAAYLLRRSHNAASIPENLRKLYSILDPDEETHLGHLDPHQLDLRTLLERYQGEDPGSWQVELDPTSETPLLSPREAMHLELVFAEFRHNHSKYSGATHLDTDLSLRPTVTCTADHRLRITFPFVANKTHFERLYRLIEERAQSPVDPADGRGEPSSGAGVYLANLAAAVVKWDLRIEWGRLSNKYIDTVKDCPQWGHCEAQARSEAGSREEEGQTLGIPRWVEDLLEDEFWEQKQESIEAYILSFHVILEKRKSLLEN